MFPDFSFREPDAGMILIGGVRLEERLRLACVRDALVVRDILFEQEWGAFESRYKPGGRPSYSPRLMAGLILYGVMRGASSLRGLERLARTDLGCMWVSGGICPDHSVIGRFINLRGDELREEFFEGLTRSVLKATGTGVGEVAGDGTVREAACSRYRNIEMEAAEKRAEEAARTLAQSPDDESLKGRAVAACWDAFFITLAALIALIALRTGRRPSSRGGTRPIQPYTP